MRPHQPSYLEVIWLASMPNRPRRQLVTLRNQQTERILPERFLPPQSVRNWMFRPELRASAFGAKRTLSIGALRTLPGCQASSGGEPECQHRQSRFRNAEPCTSIPQSDVPQSALVVYGNWHPQWPFNGNLGGSETVLTAFSLSLPSSCSFSSPRLLPWLLLVWQASLSSLRASRLSSPSFLFGLLHFTSHIEPPIERRR